MHVMDSRGARSDNVARYWQFAGKLEQALLTNAAMLVLRKGLAPCCFGPVLVEPQLVTPTTVFDAAPDPAVVPMSAGGAPKVANHGPPLEPPHISDPINVLFALLEDLKPCESLRSMISPLSRHAG